MSSFQSIRDCRPAVGVSTGCCAAFWRSSVCHWVGPLGLAVLVSLATAGCVTDAMRNVGEQTAEVVDPPAAKPATPYAGPKVRVAVSRFDVLAPKAGAEVGQGLADMLRIALVESGRFRALESLTAADLAALQGPGGSGLQATALAGQKFSRPDLLVIGTVTEFEPDVSRTNTDLSQLSFLNDLIGPTKFGFGSSHVVISLRLVEPDTTEIVAATEVEGTASSFDGLEMAGGGELGVGLSGYSKTPMATALREAVEQAVKFLVERTPPEYFREPAMQAVASASS
jgi:curli biogenesis system outer membrane secretion channel CsgG